MATAVVARGNLVGFQGAGGTTQPVFQQYPVDSFVLFDGFAPY